MILAHNIDKLVGAKFVGERPRRITIEPACGEQVRSLRFGTGAHPLNITEICWPPRTMVTRQA